MTERNSVIALLEAQHDEIETLLSHIPKLMGSQREQAFLELRRLLAVHEAIEQRIVHPKAKDDNAGQPETRVDEEHAAADLLTTLEGLDVESTEFETKFRGLQQAVLSHAETEELTEFAALQGEFDPSDMPRIQQAVREIETDITAMDVPFRTMYERSLQALS
jgi:hypothetical protein